MKIKPFLKTIIRKTGLSILWALALVVTGLIVAQFVLWSALFWLDTPAGQKFVLANLPRSFTANSYKIEITGPSYVLPTHFALGRINVYEDGVLTLSVADVKLTLDTQNFSQKRLGVSLSADVADKPIKLEAALAYEQAQKIVKLESFSFTAPDFTLQGSGSYDEEKALVALQASGVLSSLRSYPELVGNNHEMEPLHIKLDVQHTQKTGLSSSFALATKSYANRALNVSMLDIKLKGALGNGIVTISSLKMRDKDKGTLSASGTYGLDNGMAKFTLKAQELDVLRGDVANGLISADLSATGDKAQGYLIAGTVSSQKLDITIPDGGASSAPQLNVQVKGQKTDISSSAASSQDNDIIKLNIQVDVPRRIMVRGMGLDSEFGGSLNIRGTAGAPLIYGELKALRGRYSEFGKIFTLANAKIDFAGSVPPSPALDIEARTKAGDITAIITITGAALSPKIGFSSEPALPDDEVLSYILFGQEMKSLSPFQAVQLAQTLARFSGAGGSAGSALSFDPIGAVRDVTGLDDLRVETDEQGAATFGAGKYLTDNVYLEFESGTEEGSGSANVQVELTPNLTLESEIGQDSSGGATLLWKWDY